MSRNIVIAVDANDRSLDALALGRLLAEATGARAVVVTVFPYHPLADPTEEELTAVREDARGILLEFAGSAELDVADAEVIPSNLVARELQHVSERDDTGVMVVGSTTRGPIGRVLVGAVGERLLSGSACPVAVAPHGYSEQPAARLERIGVAFDGSDESRHALQAARELARSTRAELRVITVFERVTFGALTPGMRSGGASVNELKRAELLTAHDDAVAGVPEGSPVEGRFLEGPADEVLAQESAELDLLVTGSRGYGPRAAVLLGSTTHALMRAAACPGLITPRGTSLDLGA